MKTDVVIVGSGCAGLYAALKFPKEINVFIVTKTEAEASNSFLAQGGICIWKNEEDHDAYLEDTLRAGHYENDRKSVEIMITSSQEVIADLIGYGVCFERDGNGDFLYTREGGHSEKRILFYKDCTGREITGKLLEEVRKRFNITLLEYTEMTDIIEKDGVCRGIRARTGSGETKDIRADFTILASGGLGGSYPRSTNFRHIRGDAFEIADRHGIELKDMDHVQIHPTTLYLENSSDRSFLISESVRGEGARLYGKNMERFVDELLPRDLLTDAIYKRMEKDDMPFVWEDMRTIPKQLLKDHFPNIISFCKEKGFDVFKECIPVVPAQHYLMGGIKTDHSGRTSMKDLYAVGETACNGVHGRNRLASNSLLESLVFAGRAVSDIRINVYKRGVRNV